MHGSRRARGRARGHARQVHARGAKGVRLDCQRGRRRRRRLRREGKRAIRRRLDSAPARRARRLAVARRVAQAPPCREHEPGRHVGGLRARRREKHRKAAPEAGGRASAPALAVEQRRERWSAARSDARARQPRRWRVREARAVPRNVFRGRVGSRSRRRGPAAAAAARRRRPATRRAPGCSFPLPAPPAPPAFARHAPGAPRLPSPRARRRRSHPAPRRGRSRRRPRRAAPSFPSRAGPNRSRWTRARPRPSARRRPGRSGRRALRERNFGP